MAKETLVGLLNEGTGKVEQFAVDHAERILKMRKSGWELPKDSDFELSNDGTISRKDKKKGK